MMLEKILDYAPFVLNVDTGLPETHKMNWARLIEALIIAAGTAMVLNYTTVQVLTAKLDDQQTHDRQFEQQVDQRLAVMQQDFDYELTHYSGSQK